MKACCPDCGFQGELLAFLVDVEARQAIAEALRVPADLGPLVLRYLALFRPRERALALNKATRLLRELSDLIQAGAVERRGRAWPVTVAIWREALEAMLDARERLTLPLKTHGYLLEIVVSLADRGEAQAEAAVEQRRRSGAHREPSPAEKPTEPAAARAIIGDTLSRLRGRSNDD